MITVTDETFQEKVLDASGLVLVDFFTPTCPPCKLLAPILKQLNEDLDFVEIVKFDASSGTTPDNYNVTVVPTLVLLQDGQQIDMLVGLKPKTFLKAWLEDYKEH